MKREPIVFIIILVILGMKVSTLLSEKVPSGRIRAGVKSLELHEAGPVNMVANLSDDSIRRDLFLRPSADQPLAAISVPLPELPSQSILLPPPLPNPGAHVQSINLFVRPFELSGSMREDEPQDVTNDDGIVDVGSEDFADPTAQYRAEYDHIKLNAVSTLYGQIVNENRYELKQGEDLQFVEYNVDNGSVRYSVRPITGEEYQSFGFAETLRNEIELSYLDLNRSLTAGSFQAVYDYVSWLLSNGMSEPIAFDYAKELALNFCSLDPENGSNWLLLASAYEATLDYDQAFTIYALMVGDDVSSEFASGLQQNGLVSKRFAHLAAPYVSLGLVLQKLNLHDVAREQFMRAMALSDGTPYAPQALGNALMQEGMYTAARDNLQRAYNKQANRTNKEGIKNGLDLGLAMLAQLDTEAAAKVFEAGFDAEDSYLRSQAAAGSIACLYLAGNFAAAQFAAEQAIIDIGATAQLLYMRAITTGANAGDVNNVIGDLQTAISVQPLRAADSLAALSFYSDVAGDTVASESALALALEQSPKHFYARYLRAFYAARNGDMLGARSEFEELVRDNPNCAGLLAPYAALLADVGDYVKADVAFSRIEDQLQAQTKSTSSADSWANVYLRQGVNFLNLGKYDQALSAFDYTLSLDSDLHAARNARAITTYSNDDLDVAVAEFSYLQDALRDDPEHPQYLYADLWKNRLQEHDKLRRWTDEFDSKRLRPGWDLQDGARAGIAPRHHNGSIVIEGQHESAARTSVSRSVPGVSFRSYAADLMIGPGHRGAAGIALALMNRSKTTWSFEVERNREGLLSYTVSRGTRVESRNVDMNVRAGTPMRVSYSLDREPKQPVLTVRVNKQIIYSEEVVALRNPTGRMASSFFAETAHALPVDISYDNVELIYSQVQ